MCPTATRGLAAELPSTFHTHPATSLQGGSATKQGVGGKELGPLTSPALVQCPLCWPWLGILSSQVSLLKWIIPISLHPPAAKPCALTTDLCLVLLLLPQPFFFAVSYPLTQGDRKSPVGCLLLEMCHPLWSSMATSTRGAATAGRPSSLLSPGSDTIPAPLLLKK